MEDTPKETKAISEPILEEEPSAEKYLFDAAILRGKESYDAFAANISDKSKESLPGFDNLHLKQKLLFSHLRPEASRFSEVSLSRQVAAVDAHGLSIENMAFDFDQDLRKDIHRAVLSEVVSDAKDSEEAVERLAGANATFREYLRRDVEENVKKTIRQSFAEESTALREEISDRYTNLTTLRQRYIESIRPDYDRKTINALAKETEDWENKRKARDEHLHKACSEIKRNGLEEEDGVFKEPRIYIDSVNNVFRNNEMLFVDNKTREQLAKRLGVAIDDDEVGRAMGKIAKGIISDNSEFYDISQNYNESKKQIGSHDYFNDYVKKSADFSYSNLHEILQNKEKAAFLEYSRLFTNLRPEEAEEMFDRDFASELAQKRKAYIMETAGFSEEEYKTLTGGRVDHIDFHVDASQMSNQIANKCYPKGKEEMSVEQKSDLAYAARVLHYALVDEMRKAFDASKYSVPKEIQQTVFDRCLRNDSNYIHDESRRPATRKVVSSSLRSGLDREEAKAQVISVLAPKDDEELAEFTKFVEESIEDAKKHIEDSVKYRDAAARFGNIWRADDEEEYQARLNALEREKEAKLNHPEDMVAEEYGKKMQEFSHHILLNDEIDEVFILPTGFVARHSDGGYLAIPVDTTADEIAKRVKEMGEGWGAFWRRYLRSDEYNNPAYKGCIIRTVNERVEADFASNIEFADEETRTVYERCKENGIEVPAVLESRAGSFSEQLTEVDCDNYEHCREKFGRYFDVITTIANGTYEPDESVLEKSVRDYMFTGSAIGAEAIAKTPGKESVILKRYSVLAKKLGQDVADSYIINNVCSNVFTKNERNLTPILRNVLGDEINISTVTALRLTGKKIASAESRQMVAMRTLFAANYSRYLRGEAIENARLAELIRRVDELEFGKAES